MKKCTIYLAALLIMAALIFLAYKTWSPEYRICRSFSYSGMDYRETELYVIINRPWGVGETVEKIVIQYNQMNGTRTVWSYGATIMNMIWTRAGSFIRQSLNMGRIW